MDAVLKNEEIETEKQIEGAKLGVELSKQQNELTEKQKTEGLKIGLQVAKDLTEPDATKEMPNIRDGV